MTTRANVKSRQGLYFRMKNNSFITIYYVIKIRNLPADKNNPVVKWAQFECRRDNFKSHVPE